MDQVQERKGLVQCLAQIPEQSRSRAPWMARYLVLVLGEGLGPDHALGLIQKMVQELLLAQVRVHYHRLGLKQVQMMAQGQILEVNFRIWWGERIRDPHQGLQQEQTQNLDLDQFQVLNLHWERRNSQTQI